MPISAIQEGEKRHKLVDALWTDDSWEVGKKDPCNDMIFGFYYILDKMYQPAAVNHRPCPLPLWL